MPVTLPEPDGSNPDGSPLWKCPHCEGLKQVEDFGWRKRDDIYPGQGVWQKQSWCKNCRGSAEVDR
jgi:hypothetical protein